MIKAKAPQKPYNLYVTVEATEGVELMLYGYEPNKRNTVHFLRQYGDSTVADVGLFKGVHTFEFPFPYPPSSKLRIEAYCNIKGKNASIKIKNVFHKKREKLSISFEEHIQEFIDFALQFSRNCGFLELGIYESKTGLYNIVFDDYVKKWEGKNDVLKTPARVDHNSGIIEVSKWWFDQLTVTNRMLVLCHEFAHFYFGSTNESECDIIGAHICLTLGLSKTECMYAISRLFDNCGTDEECKEYRFRKEQIIKYIEEWNS